MTVLAFDPNRRTNAQAIADAHELGYITEDDFVLDMTYERGRFWNLWRPSRDLALVKNDLNPKMGNVHFDFRKMPWMDGYFSVVVFDPPYGFRGTSKHAMDESYGLGEYLSVDERLTLMRDGMKEAARLSNRTVLMKLQDQVVSGEKVWQRILFANYGESIGLRLVDELHVVGYRAQPQRKCRVCGGVGHLGPGTGADQRDYGRECVVCEGSGKVDMVQKHSASNVSTLQVYRR